MNKQRIAGEAVACLLVVMMLAVVAFAYQAGGFYPAKQAQASEGDLISEVTHLESASVSEAAHLESSAAVSTLAQFALVEQSAQADAEIFGVWLEAKAVAEAGSESDDSVNTKAPNSQASASTTREGNTSSSSPEKRSSSLDTLATRNPRTITIDGVTMSYTDAYGSSSAPSSGAGVWKGSDSTTDGSYGYFIGHNPGSFGAAASATNGSKVTVSDSNGDSRTYTVVDSFSVPEGSAWSDIADRVTSHGESVVLQTCLNGEYKILIAEG